MSSPSRAVRKSRNVPPARIMDDMFEYSPPATTILKEEQFETTGGAPSQERIIDSPEKEGSQEESTISVENRSSKQTYAEIIKEEMIKSDTKTLSLDEIFIILDEDYPWKTRSARWKETVRRTLSQNDQFQLSNSSTGQLWRLSYLSRSASHLAGSVSQDPSSDYLDEEPGKSGLDEVNEDDFDMGDSHIVNCREDAPQDDIKHVEPVHKMGAISRSSNVVASENGHNYSNPDRTEDKKNCSVCGRALRNFKNPDMHLLLCRKKMGICPKCGEVRHWRCPAQFKKHMLTCDPIRKMCKDDHEHKLIDKTFGTFEDGIAYFYDNEYDTELSISSGSKNKRIKGVKYEYLLFACARSNKGNNHVHQEKTRVYPARKLDKKCPAQIIMRGGWLNDPGTNNNSAAVTRMYGCTAHNHPDNPTMKRVSWLMKRRIAKFLLLGHSRIDIRSNLMPKFHIEGHKKVDLMCVTRIQRIMETDKRHKLREGHDLASLLGNTGATERGVYPWPTPTNCPQRNEARKRYFQNRVNTKAKKKTQMMKISNSNGELRGGSLIKSSDEQEEVEEAVNSIEKENASLVGAEAARDHDIASQGEVLVSVPEGEPILELTVASTADRTELKMHVGSALRDEDADIDSQAFDTLRQKALRCLGPLGFPGTIAERLSPKISALEATGAGMAKLRKILQVGHQDLTRGIKLFFCFFERSLFRRDRSKRKDSLIISVKPCRTSYAVVALRAHVRRLGDGAPEAAPETGECEAVRAGRGKRREENENQVRAEEEEQETLHENSR